MVDPETRALRPSKRSTRRPPRSRTLKRFVWDRLKLNVGTFPRIRKNIRMQKRSISASSASNIPKPRRHSESTRKHATSDVRRARRFTENQGLVSMKLTEKRAEYIVKIFVCLPSSFWITRRFTTTSIRSTFTSFAKWTKLVPILLDTSPKRRSLNKNTTLPAVSASCLYDFDHIMYLQCF